MGGPESTRAWCYDAGDIPFFYKKKKRNCANHFKAEYIPLWTKGTRSWFSYYLARTNRCFFKALLYCMKASRNTKNWSTFPHFFDNRGLFNMHASLPVARVKHERASLLMFCSAVSSLFIVMLLLFFYLKLKHGSGNAPGVLLVNIFSLLYFYHPLMINTHTMFGSESLRRWHFMYKYWTN